MSCPCVFTSQFDRMLLFTFFTAVTAPLVLAKSAPDRAELPVKLEVRRPVDSSVANIHVNGYASREQPLSYTYGSCDATNQHGDGLEHHIGQSRGHDRLIWRLPAHGARSGRCISAWNSASDLVGRSEPIEIQQRRIEKRTKVSMDNSSHIDAEGPWFDGVALLRSLNMSAVDTEAAKSKDVAIVGAGMAGLMTWLCLHQAGMKNLHIVEAAQRLGGRVHTAYFGDPSERLYQEMGPMRVSLSRVYDALDRIRDEKKTKKELSLRS
jgi:hypothetical protein